MGDASDEILPQHTTVNKAEQADKLTIWLNNDNYQASYSVRNALHVTSLGREAKLRPWLPRLLDMSAEESTHCPSISLTYTNSLKRMMECCRAFPLIDTPRRCRQSRTPLLVVAGQHHESDANPCIKSLAACNYQALSNKLMEFAVLACEPHELIVRRSAGLQHAFHAEPTSCTAIGQSQYLAGRSAVAHRTPCDRRV